MPLFNAFNLASKISGYDSLFSTPNPDVTESPNIIIRNVFLDFSNGYSLSRNPSLLMLIVDILGSHTL
jgi:hypothetical protein